VAESIALKDSYQETRIFYARLLVLSLTILVLCGILLSRYFTLQVLHYEDYATRSEANRILTQVVPAPRGLITDRNGTLLADNRPNFSLNLVRERITDLKQTFQILRELIDLKDEEIERFHQLKKKRGHRPFQSIPLRYQLSDEEIARIAVNEWRLPGVEISAQLIRHYTFPELTAHNIGYVGSINEKDIQYLLKQDRWKHYEGVVYSMGKLGLEKIYEQDLFGENGTRNVEVNARGQVLREIDKQAPVPGKNLSLFLDIDLQEIATHQLGKHRGAVVAIETQTGGVIAAVSTPSFNSNLFVTGISNREYAQLRDDWRLPLFNRLIQGQYPPGSTLKPLMGLLGLEEQVIDPSYSIQDPGYFQLPNDDRLYRDWKRGGHGKHVNLRKAISQSCDTYFYTLGVRLGVDRISPFLARFGLGNPTGVDLTYERGGILPNRQWKQERDGRPWFPGDTVNLSIGQGDMLSTPMQLAYMTSIIANRGKKIVPRMVQTIGQIPTSLTEEAPVILKNQANWEQIIQGMEDVVHHPHGTASHLSRHVTYRMAGKTGTAQVIGIKQDDTYDRETIALRNRDHALFIAFAPVDKPRIAVAVIVENGESGSGTAAPIAKAVIDAYLTKQEKEGH
jgi:penicillin-binding protein 2